MDFFIPFVLSVLLPFSLDLSDIKYTPEVGVFFSQQQKSPGFNLPLDTYKVAPILSGYNDKNTQNVLLRYTRGNPKTAYDAFLNYKINVAFKNRLWVSSKVSWAPMREELSIAFGNPATPQARPTTRLLFFSELPAVGAMVGLDILKYTPNTFWHLFDFSFSPYIGGSLLRISYATANEYEAQSFYANTFKWYAGFNIQLDYNAKLYVEYTSYSADLRSASGLGQNVQLQVSRLKVGFSYVFTDDFIVRKSNKDSNYEEIFKSLEKSTEE
jgi:hypothetical protein